MPGGCRIKNHEVVCGSRGPWEERLDDAHDTEHFVQARRRQIEQILHHRAVERRVEARATAQGVEELVDLVTITRASLSERRLGVQLDDVDPVHARGTRDRNTGHRRIQDVGQRMSGIR